MCRLPFQRGYTLIEMLVYVAIVSLGAVLIVSAILGFGKGYIAYKAAQDVHRNASFALERITRESKGAISVNTGASTLGAHPGRLTLNTETGAGVATTVEFAIQNNRLMVKEGSGAFAPLTGSGVVVQQFIVEHFPGTISEAVRFKLVLSRTRGTVSKSSIFWTGTVLRGSYTQ